MDNEGPCAVDEPQTCGDSVSFSNFKVEDIKALPKPVRHEDQGDGAVAVQSEKAVLILEAPKVPAHFLDGVKKATLATEKGHIPVQVVSIAWDGSSVKPPEPAAVTPPPMAA